MKLKQLLLLTLSVLSCFFTVGESLPKPSGFNPSPALAQSSQEVEAKKVQADKLIEQGIEQYYRSDFRGALASWQEALDIYTEIGNIRGEAQSLGGLGIAYQNLGNYPKAIDFYEQSLSWVGIQIGEGA